MARMEDLMQRLQDLEQMVMDRRPLPYLNWIEKLGCIYCSYFNGLMAMMSEVAARTEQHFFPIKHALRPKTLHSRYRYFFDYGDMEAYRTRLEAVRHNFADVREAAVGPLRNLQTSLRRVVSSRMIRILPHQPGPAPGRCRRRAWRPWPARPPRRPDR